MALSNDSESRGPQTPGLYRTLWEGDKWVVKDDSYTAMDLSQQNSNAHSAIIPGKFESKEVAGRKIAEHLENAYFSDIFSRDENRQKTKQLSMFWLNNEFTSDAHVKSLVSMMQMARKESKGLRWLVHGEACGTFVRAAEYLKKNPVSDNPHEAQKGFALQSFYFSNPRGRRTSESDLKKICEDVGFNCTGVKVNKSDIFKNSNARKNALWKSATTVAGIGVAVMGGKGAAGAVGDDFIGVDTMVKIKDALLNDPASAITAGLVVCGGIVLVAKSLSLGGFAKHVGGIASTTFRNGNQNWAA